MCLHDRNRSELPDGVHLLQLCPMIVTTKCNTYGHHILTKQSLWSSHFNKTNIPSREDSENWITVLHQFRFPIAVTEWKSPLSTAFTTVYRELPAKSICVRLYSDHQLYQEKIGTGKFTNTATLYVLHPRLNFLHIFPIISVSLMCVREKVRFIMKS